MGVEEWCGLTPTEWEAICAAYNEKRTADYENEWERMRMLATITIQPHVKGKLTPAKLLPYPWDNRKEETASEQVSKDEALRRFKSLINKDKDGQRDKI